MSDASRAPTDPANAERIALWNSVLFDKFARFRALVTASNGAHGRAALDRHPPRRGARVLEVGAGFGDFSLDLARAVGPEGEVVSLDAAERFVDAARIAFASADRTDLAALEARVGDAQTAALGGPYDHVYARFGTMFFASPVPALANLRASLVPGGTLCMVVWRRREATPSFVIAAEVVRRVLGLAPPPPSPAPPEPGPFSMADPDLVSDQLLAAGFVDPTFARSDVPLLLGRDLDEAVAFALTLGPGGEVMRLAGPAAEARRPEIVQALAEAFRPFVTSRGVASPSSAWIVTARAPTDKRPNP
jgi:SAM-dependent methyltransferase